MDPVARVIRVPKSWLYAILRRAYASLVSYFVVDVSAPGAFIFMDDILIIRLPADEVLVLAPARLH